MEGLYLGDFFLQSSLPSFFFSKSIGIIDRENRLVAILAGHPDVEDWPLLQDQAAKALETRRTRCSIPKEARNRAHRRGKFVTLNCGVSYGGGQQVPGNLCHNPVNEQILLELNDLEPFGRVAGFASCTLTFITTPDAMAPYSHLPSGYANLGPQTLRPL